MSLTSDFERNPTGFLKDYVVVVPSQEEAKDGIASPKPVAFYLKAMWEGSKVVELVQKSAWSKVPDAIQAYWLPWCRDKAVAMDLGADADFLFTSEMTNCRFSVLTGGVGKPKVAHVAGNGGPGQRDRVEKLAGFPTKAEDPDKLVRRLSSSDGGAYTGQRKTEAESSSAFVFGHRVDGKWKFYAQICGGTISGDAFSKGLIPKTLKAIGDLYDFGK